MSGRIKTQADLVAEAMGGANQHEVRTEYIRLPGLDVLHKKTKEEVAEIITNVLKSQANIVGMKWMFGTSMELYVKE